MTSRAAKNRAPDGLAASDGAPDGNREARPVGSLGLALRLLVFGAGFAVASAFLWRVASPGGGVPIGPKLEHYRAHPERYSTVVLGTSHVYRGFVPEEFDRVLAQAGVASSSFNLGVQLPGQIELGYLLRQVLEAGRGHVQRVLVQYHELMPQIDPTQTFIPRTIYWHDPAATLLAVERTMALGEGGELRCVEPEKDSRRYSLPSLALKALPAAWRISGEHAQHALARTFLIGRGKDVARGILRRPYRLTEVFAATRGYVSLEQENRRLLDRGADRNKFQRRRRYFQEHLEEYEEGVAALERSERVFGDEQWMLSDLQRFGDVEAYRRMAAAAGAAGVELLIVVMPSMSCDRPVEERMAAELGVPLLRFNRPSRYPELYDPEYRFDSGHLSEEGAAVFSRLLAREVLAAGKPGEAAR